MVVPPEPSGIFQICATVPARPAPPSNSVRDHLKVSSKGEKELQKLNDSLAASPLKKAKISPFFKMNLVFRTSFPRQASLHDYSYILSTTKSIC
jgi:hypothetical protein